MKNSSKYRCSTMALAMLSLLIATVSYADGHSRGGSASGRLFGSHTGGGYNGRSYSLAPQSRPSAHYSTVPQQNYSFRPNSSPVAGSPGRTYSYVPPLSRGASPRFYRDYRSYRGYYYGGYHPYFYGGGYFHFWGGYYSRFYAPYVGFRLRFLPFGYFSFSYGPDLYYYYNGLFYQQYYPNDYRVVTPPLGAIVNNLPRGAQSIVIDGQQFYQLNGVYYQPVTNTDGTISYKIAGKDGELNTNSNAPATGKQQYEQPAPVPPAENQPTDPYNGAQNNNNQQQPNAPLDDNQ